MLSGSAFLRVGILVLVAAILAGVVQMVLPRDTGPVDVPVVKPAPETGKAGTQAAPPPVVTRPAPPVPVAPAPQAAAPVPAPPAPAPTPAPIMPPPAPAERPPLDFARPPTPAQGEAEIDSAAENAGPRGIAIVDLNTASVAELNGLKGGGMIGRAIVQKRPYASVGDLLGKRVLSRAVYERIKDQVTVR